jgi:hypothetical protein
MIHRKTRDNRPQTVMHRGYYRRVLEESVCGPERTRISYFALLAMTTSLLSVE